MSCDPNTLLSTIACFEQKIQGQMLDAVEIVLLCAILDGETMSCDPQELISQATCIFTTIPPGAMMAVKLSLLCQIADGGGGGGGGSGQIKQYTGADPNSDGILPADQSLPAVAYKDDGSAPTYSWNTTSHVWQ